VLQAAQGPQALDIVPGVPGPDRSLAHDVRDAGMNGRELADQVKLIRPEIRSSTCPDTRTMRFSATACRPTARTSFRSRFSMDKLTTKMPRRPGGRGADGRTLIILVIGHLVIWSLNRNDQITKSTRCPNSPYGALD